MLLDVHMQKYLITCLVDAIVALTHGIFLGCCAQGRAKDLNHFSDITSYECNSLNGLDNLLLLIRLFLLISHVCTLNSNRILSAI